MYEEMLQAGDLDMDMGPAPSFTLDEPTFIQPPGAGLIMGMGPAPAWGGLDMATMGELETIGPVGIWSEPATRETPTPLGSGGYERDMGLARPPIVQSIDWGQFSFDEPETFVFAESARITPWDTTSSLLQPGIVADPGALYEAVDYGVYPSIDLSTPTGRTRTFGDISASTGGAHGTRASRSPGGANAVASVITGLADAYSRIVTATRTGRDAVRDRDPSSVSASVGNIVGAFREGLNLGRVGAEGSRAPIDPRTNQAIRRVAPRVPTSTVKPGISSTQMALAVAVTALLVYAFKKA